MTKEITIIEPNTAIQTDVTGNNSNTRSDVLKTWLGNIGSKNTLRSYRRAWNELSDVVSFNHPYDLTKADVTNYRQYLKSTLSPRTGKPLGECTINLRIAAISSFFKHAIKHYDFDGRNPCDVLTREKVNPYGKSQPINVFNGDLEKFVGAIPTDTLQGKRDYAIIRLMLSTGVRVSAIEGATIGSIKQFGSEYFLSYKNKGGATETTELRAAMNPILNYLKARGATLKDTHEPLFMLTQQGKTTAIQTGHYGNVDNGIQGRSINNLIKKYSKIAGLDGIHAHTLRHTAAALATKEGANVGQIKDFLKHKSVGVTGIYLDNVINNQDSPIIGGIDAMFESL